MSTPKRTHDIFAQSKRRIYFYMCVLAILTNLIVAGYAEFNELTSISRRLLNLFIISSLLTLTLAILSKRISIRKIELSLFGVGIVLCISTLAFVLYVEPYQPSQRDLLTIFLWLPGIYVMTFFVFSIRRAALTSLGVFACLFSLLLPYSLSTQGGSATFDGILPFAQLALAHLFTITALYGFAVFKAHALRQEAETQVLRQQVITDSLTGLSNRRHMLNLLEAEFQRAERYEHTFSIILFDVDEFKHFNDTYGHDVGDEILEKISEFFTTQLRGSDTAARWGGEEFLVLLPETTNNDALHVANNLKKQIPFDIRFAKRALTVSGGVATFAATDSVKSFIKRADDALYKAKKNGKNQIQNQTFDIPIKESQVEPASAGA